MMRPLLESSNFAKPDTAAEYRRVHMPKPE